MARGYHIMVKLEHILCCFLGVSSLLLVRTVCFSPVLHTKPCSYPPNELFSRYVLVVALNCKTLLLI